jgi:hypothetical protein
LNIIRFDQGEELPNNVLGVCYSYYSACREGQWYIAEYDIVFDDDANWEYGPANAVTPKFDFESVAFHELGHGLQLGHVINPQDVMHYAIAPGTQQREPIQNDIDCAKLVLSQSKALCDYAAMKQITADVCDDSYFAYFESKPPRIYPIPLETGSINITYFLTDDQEINIDLIDLTGKRVMEIMSGFQKKGEHTITKDLSSQTLATGVYILRSHINNTDYTSKMISIR